MEDSIGDITIAHITEKASANENDEIDLLLAEKEQAIDKLAASLARIFRKDKDELKQHLRIKFWEDYGNLRDHKCINAWFKTIGTNLCLNELRHIKVEIAFQEKTLSETQNSKRRGGKTLIQSPPVGTPEDELLEREHRFQLERIVREATEPFPKWLVEGWRMERSAKELSNPEIPGRSLKTVYRKLREMQKAIEKAIKDSGIKPYEN